MVLTLGVGDAGHAVDLVVYRHGAGLEHGIVQLFLLQVCKLRLEFVVVDGICGGTLGEGAGDFLADRVLLLEIFHGSIDLVDCQATVNGLHGLGGVAQGVESLLVDVCRLYTGNLALKVHDLSRRLFQGGLELLLLSQSVLGGCERGLESVARGCRSSSRTRLVGVDKLSGLLVLLIHLVLQVLFALVEHLEGAPQLQYGLLGGIFLRGRVAAKPTTQPPAGHVVCVSRLGLWLEMQGIAIGERESGGKRA